MDRNSVITTRRRGYYYIGESNKILKEFTGEIVPVKAPVIDKKVMVRLGITKKNGAAHALNLK